LDRFSCDLRYCLHLLIGLCCVEVDHSRWFSAMGGMGPQMIIEVDR
jgi:hypothetical protein